MRMILNLVLMLSFRTEIILSFLAVPSMNKHNEAIGSMIYIKLDGFLNSRLPNIIILLFDVRFQKPVSRDLHEVITVKKNTGKQQHKPDLYKNKREIGILPEMVLFELGLFEPVYIVKYRVKSF